MLTAARPSLSQNWRARPALSLSSWRYLVFKAHRTPATASQVKPLWFAEGEIVSLCQEAQRMADHWLSVVTPESLPATWATIQALGDHRIEVRVAVAWLLKVGLRLPESLRELLPLVGADVPDMASYEVVNKAAMVLWAKMRALPKERHGELREAFRSWEGLEAADAAATVEWFAYLRTHGVGGGEA